MFEIVADRKIDERNCAGFTSLIDNKIIAEIIQVCCMFYKNNGHKKGKVKFHYFNFQKIQFLPG